MSRALAFLCVAIVLLAARPAASVSLAVGSHLGFEYIWSDHPETGTSSIFAWPANALGYQPGLRLAVGDARHAHELFVDSGLLVIDQAGSTLSTIPVLVGYQHTAWADRPNAPFVNVGVGFYREGGSSRSATSTFFGAGLGLRHVVGDRHGDVRIEARFDRLLGTTTFGRPILNTFGLRVGFDLWS